MSGEDVTIWLVILVLVGVAITWIGPPERGDGR
jgi:hypothetical protein